MRTLTKGIDYTNRDYEAYRESMIATLQEKMPEYTDTSQTDAGIVILEALANGLDVCSMYNDAVANDVLLPTTQDRRLAMISAKCLGYTPYSQTASVTPQVFVLNSIKDEDFIIGKGTVVSTEETADSVAVTFETVEDLVIPSGKLGNEQDEHGNYLYTVDVIEGSTIDDDLLGSSTGAPYQTFKLNFPNVLVDSLAVYVDEGDGSKLWTYVSTMLDSDINGTSKVYTVTSDDFDNYYIEFGNGIKGKIPAICENGISASYRVGGGEIGNVKANMITVLETSIAQVEETFNPVESTTLGHEKETLEEIKVNAPASFRSIDRAVTLTDYEDLLQINNEGDFYGVYRSKAIRDSSEGTKVNLYYLMRPNYTMTPKLQSAIIDFFSTRTMIGTSVELFNHNDYVVNLTGTLTVDRDYFNSEVLADVESYIKTTFFAFGKFSFDDSLVLSDLESAVKSSVQGVRSLRISSPSNDIVTPDTKDKIIKLGTLTLNTSGGKEEGV